MKSRPSIAAPPALRCHRLQAGLAGVAEAADILRARRSRRLPDRDGLRARRGRHGPARPSRRIYAAKGRPHFNPLIAHVTTSRRPRGEGRLRRDSARARPRLLAGAADARRAGRAAGAAVCDLARAGLDERRAARAGASLGAALLDGRGPAGRRALGQSLGPCQPDARPPMCSPISTGASTPVLDGGATPIGLESTIIACLGGKAAPACAPAASRARRSSGVVGQLGSAAAAGEATPRRPRIRSRRASSPPIMRRAPR